VPPSIRIKDRRMFQIIRVELNRDGHVVARWPLQPLYELFDDAMALAEFDASRCAGDYGYDEQYDGWWARDGGRSYRFVIEEVAPTSLAS
jgi:hypothetical protein